MNDVALTIAYYRLDTAVRSLASETAQLQREEAARQRRFAAEQAAAVVAAAMRWLGIPYSWGSGASFFLFFFFGEPRSGGAPGW